MKKLLMGNEAIAYGAVQAGVNVVCGYPGTPSTEVLETVAKIRCAREDSLADLYVEWSVNEKAALELAAGASYAGARTMVTMKQVGLNVASDPLMSLAYVGVKGAMVVVVADDPGPISSQTEQDTRHFARFAKLPVFDPSSPEEAFQMIGDAFDYSEKYHTPVLFRPTTRVCHGCATIDVGDERYKTNAEGFVKDSKWVIFPRLTYQNHMEIEKRNVELGEIFSEYKYNQYMYRKSGKAGIATGGVSYDYLREALENVQSDTKLSILKIATPFPFPEKLAVEFLRDVNEVVVIEELDPVIERELTYLCGKYHLGTVIKGKLTGDVQNAGENSVQSIATVLKDSFGIESDIRPQIAELPPLPMRPPVLCAGCPHRASFYAVKQAMKGKKAVFSGDIGCYTLGNSAPLDMVDTCLCMGADITVAQGLHRIEPDATNFAFIGDSTFFASGMTGVANAVYNDTDIVLIVLDNSTTAMTGHQPHPGTGKTMMGNFTEKIDIGTVLTALGVKSVVHQNPFDLRESIATVKNAAAQKGVSAVIFESPCIALIKQTEICTVNNNTCIGCQKCIKELGCPAISMENGKALIDSSACYGCNICAEVCPTNAIEKECK